MNRPDPTCGEDVAAYALGAQSPEEAERTRRHLASCAVCLEELVAFQAVVDELATSPDRIAAPRALRRRVLRAVAAEPRLDPQARMQRRRDRLSFPALGLSPALAGGLGLLLVAVVVGVLALASGGGGTSRRIAAQVTGRGSATLRISGGHGELVVRRFPSPPRGKIYEVWLERNTGQVQATTALFGVDGAGDGDADVPGSLHGVTHVLVTPEPAGGSRKPTHTPVISARL